MYKPKSVLENGMHKTLWDFQILIYLTKWARPDLVLISKKKRTCHIMDFVVLAEDRVKEGKKKINKCLNLARELKRLWNMKVTVILVVVDVQRLQ